MKTTRRMSKGAQHKFAQSWLERQGVEGQTVDTHSLIDGSLSYEENVKLLKKELQLGGRSKKKATRDLSAAECDVAIGNYDAGMNHGSMEDACSCGHPDACDDVDAKKRKAAAAKARAKAKPKKPTKTRGTADTVKTITNNMPAGYKIQKWRYEDNVGGKHTAHAVLFRGKAVFGQNKVFDSLPAARKAVKEHASSEVSRKRNQADRKQFAEKGYIGKPTPKAKPKAKPKPKKTGVTAQTGKKKKATPQHTLSGKKKPQKKPKKVKKCVRVKVQSHTRKCPTRTR